MCFLVGLLMIHGVCAYSYETPQGYICPMNTYGLPQQNKICSISSIIEQSGEPCYTCKTCEEQYNNLMHTTDISSSWNSGTNGYCELDEVQNAYGRTVSCYLCETCEDRGFYSTNPFGTYTQVYPFVGNNAGVMCYQSHTTPTTTPEECHFIGYLVEGGGCVLKNTICPGESYYDSMDRCKMYGLRQGLMGIPYPYIFGILGLLLVGGYIVFIKNKKRKKR